MTSTVFADFQRVSKQYPCPVCGKPDWCLISRDDAASPSRAICKRVESARPWGSAGYLHELRPQARERDRPRGRWSIELNRSGPSVFDTIVQDAIRSIHHTNVLGLAARLSVTPESLVRLSIGWIDRHRLAELGTKNPTGVWSFPMHDHVGRVCGVRLRSASSFKFAIPGSKNGLFIPMWQAGPPDRLLIAEGESDTAAMLDLGFCTIGKPGAGNADELTVRYVRNIRPRSIVVVADNDAIGRSRAQSLGRHLSTVHANVRVIFPPDGVKDAREWKKRGANAASIESAIAATAPIRLVISVTKRGA